MQRLFSCSERELQAVWKEGGELSLKSRCYYAYISVKLCEIFRCQVFLSTFGIKEKPGIRGMPIIDVNSCLVPEFKENKSISRE